MNAPQATRTQGDGGVKALHESLDKASQDGTLDELAAFMHPDRINEFVDNVAKMAQP